MVTLLPIIWIMYIDSLTFATILSDEIIVNLTYTIKEELDPPIVLGNIIADLDLRRHTSPQNLHDNTLTFFPWSQMSAKYFMIYKESSTSQTLVLQKRIDREKLCSFQSQVTRSKIFATCICDRRTCFMLISLSFMEYRPEMLVITVRVNIDDINDHSPVFQQSQFTVFFREELPVSEWSYQLIPYASDLDFGDNCQLAYRITTFSELFELANNTGSNDVKIVPKKRLDREIQGIYSIIVEAIDGGQPTPLTGYLNLTVNIVDINDSQPTFSERSVSLISVFVSEYYPIDYVIADITAYDNDSGVNAMLRFQLNEKLSDPYGYDHFVINSSTGSLYISRPLDREVSDSVGLVIMVSDGGSPSRSSSMSLTVVINDENDNKPIIECQDHFEIDENRPSNSTIGLVKVYDFDSGANSNVTCIIEPSSHFLLRQVGTDSFSYIKKSLIHDFEISTKMSFDRETESAYVITMLCFDHGLPAMTSSKELTVFVGDQNDNIPIFNQSNARLDLLENQVPLKSILNLSASDNDSGLNSELLYFVIDNIDNNFMVNKTTGELFQTESIDYERHKSFTIRVGCRDRGLISLTGSIQILINVLDVNDIPPTISAESMSPQVAEHMPVGTLVSNLIVNDPDTGAGGEVILYLLPWEKKFTIRGFQLFTNHEFDRELNDRYSILVILRDNGLPRLTSSILLTVTIIDINDHSPSLSRIDPSPGVKVNNLTISFSYREPQHFPISMLQFYDQDMGDNSRLKYSIEECSKPIFKLQSYSGQLKLNVTCRSTDVGVVELVVKVADHGWPARYTFLRLSVILVDGPATSQEHIIITNFRVILIIVPILIALSFCVILMFVIRTLQRQTFRPNDSSNCKKNSKDQVADDNLQLDNDELLMNIYPTTSYYPIYTADNYRTYSSYIPFMNSQDIMLQPYMAQNYMLSINQSSSFGNGHKIVSVHDTSTDSGNGDSSDINVNDCLACSISNSLFNSFTITEPSPVSIND